MNDFSMKLEVPAEHVQKIFGLQDVYLKKMERDFGVMIVDRNGGIVISGEEDRVKKAARVLEQLVIISDRGNEIEEQNVDYAITMGMEEQEQVIAQID